MFSTRLLLTIVTASLSCFISTAHSASIKQVTDSRYSLTKAEVIQIAKRVVVRRDSKVGLSTCRIEYVNYDINSKHWTVLLFVRHIKGYDHSGKPIYAGNDEGERRIRLTRRGKLLGYNIGD